MSVIELGLPWKLMDYGSVQVLHNHFGYGWQRIICNANLLQNSPSLHFWGVMASNYFTQGGLCNSCILPPDTLVFAC